MVHDIFAVIVGKTIYWVLRRAGRHGGALPGLVVEKLHPKLLHKLTHLPDGVIVVSGTNGKTTTTHLLSEALRRSGKKVFTNHSGSNMTRGLLASIVRFGNWKGDLKYDVAVLEIDEAYAAKLAPLLRPRIAVLTNVLRDQLDRFGEIDATAKLLGQLANHSDMLVYNACDTRIQAIGESHKEAYSYGYINDIADHFPSDDAWYGEDEHLVPPSTVQLQTRITATATYMVNNTSVRIHCAKLPGWHNALNLGAVLCTLTALGLKTNLDDLEPPYGRGEEVNFHGSKLTLQLVKNPGGFKVAMDVEPSVAALVIINDRVADSRDVSWLWDVDVAQLGHRPAIHAAGLRAYDMANRLKYADIQTETVIEDTRQSLENFAHLHKEGVVFLTYTAMIETRRILKGNA